MSIVVHEVLQGSEDKVDESGVLESSFMYERSSTTNPSVWSRRQSTFLDSAGTKID